MYFIHSIRRSYSPHPSLHSSQSSLLWGCLPIWMTLWYLNFSPRSKESDHLSYVSPCHQSSHTPIRSCSSICYWMSALRSDRNSCNRSLQSLSHLGSIMRCLLRPVFYSRISWIRWINCPYPHPDSSLGRHHCTSSQLSSRILEDQTGISSTQEGRTLSFLKILSLF